MARAFQKIPADLIAEIRRLRDAGEKSEWVAAHLGISRTTVKKYSVGCRKRPGTRGAPTFDHGAALRLVASGLSKTEAARQLGVTRDAVRFVIRRKAA
jgi:predicted transcriptional regulator